MQIENGQYNAAAIIIKFPSGRGELYPQVSLSSLLYEYQPPLSLYSSDHGMVLYSSDHGMVKKPILLTWKFRPRNRIKRSPSLTPVTALFFCCWRYPENPFRFFNAHRLLFSGEGGGALQLLRQPQSPRRSS